MQVNDNRVTTPTTPQQEEHNIRMQYDPEYRANYNFQQATKDQALEDTSLDFLGLAGLGKGLAAIKEAKRLEPVAEYINPVREQTIAEGLSKAALKQAERVNIANDADKVKKAYTEMMWRDEAKNKANMIREATKGKYVDYNAMERRAKLRKMFGGTE